MYGTSLGKVINLYARQVRNNADGVYMRSIELLDIDDNRIMTIKLPR